MRVIGGEVSWEAARADDCRPAELVLGASEGTVTARGPISLFDNTHQGDAEGGISVVAELDLVNEKELRALIRPTGGSCQLVAALYAREGWRFVRRLRGAFAIALWDAQTHELLLAVDHFGIKRLYYIGDHRRTLFANRASAFRMIAGVDAQVDLTSIYSYLNFGFVPAPASAFQGVRRLEPGHLLRACDGQIKLEPYWDMKYPERPISRDAAATELYRLTEEAVGRALANCSARDVGAFLSGGTDSSTIVGLMSHSIPQPVNAFSVGFQEDAYNELHYAELAARHFGAIHHTKTVTPDEALELLPRLVEAYDEPFGNNSAIGTFACAELARERGVKLLLAGDGGDEIFGGNERYRTDRIFAVYHNIPRSLRRGVLEPIVTNLPDGGDSVLGRAQRYIRRANLPNPRRFYSYEFFFALNAADLFSSDFLATVELDAPYRVVQASYDRVQATSELNRLLYLDLKLTIGDNDLHKVTRTAELAGVQVRFPLLGLDLVEFTGILPADLKVRRFEKRHLFKRAVQKLLPREILAKQKHGFGVPTSAWLRQHPKFQDLARETVLSTRARERGYFRVGAMEAMLDSHRRDSTPYYGDLLWRALMLELWHRRHVDAESAA